MRLGLVEAKWTFGGWFTRFVSRIVILLSSFLVVGLLVFLIWIAIESIAARKAERDLEAAWAEMGRPWTSILERYPAHGTNDSVYQLESLATPLGLRLAPRGEDVRPETRDGLEASSQVIRKLLGEFTRRVTSADRRFTEPLPEEIKSYLEQHTVSIEEIVEHLLSAEPPAWEQDPGMAPDALAPYFLDHIMLTRLLVVRAVLQIYSADFEGAERSIEAGWRLYRTAADRPELISQLVGVNEAQLVVGAMRMHPRPPDSWPSMILEEDLRESFFDAMQAESWGRIEVVPKGQVFSGDGFVSSLFTRFSMPNMRCQMVAQAEALQEGMESMRATPFADFDAGEGYSVWLETLLPSGQISRNAFDYWETWARINRLMLCLELTADVVNLRVDVRRSGRSAVLNGLPSERESRVDPSIIWRITRNGNNVLVEPSSPLPVVNSAAQTSLCSSYLLEVVNDR